MTIAREKMWRELVKQLKSEFPLRAPVSVRRVRRKKDDLHGWTTFDGTRIWIYVVRRIDFSVMLDTLLHEWAHARVIDQSFTHGEAWGKEYASIFDAYDLGIILGE